MSVPHQVGSLPGMLRESMLDNIQRPKLSLCIILRMIMIVKVTGECYRNLCSYWENREGNGRSRSAGESDIPPKHTEEVRNTLEGIKMRKRQLVRPRRPQIC